MKISRKQLRRIIREAVEKKDGNEATVKYNADPALKGDQTKLPDKMQKGIIDSANEDEGKLKEIDGADHLFSKSEVESLIDVAINNTTSVASDLATANRDRGSARTALVLRAMAANKKVLEQLQRLKKIARN